MTENELIISSMSEQVLRIQLEEWHRKYDAIDTAYDRVRSRSVALLSIQIALAGFFISQLNHLIKHELYGQVFLVFGAILFIYSAYLTFMNYRANSGWSSPMWDLEIEKMNNSKNTEEALNVLLKDYKYSYDCNLSIHEPAAKRLNLSLFVFIGAVIILVVLNFT
jgi:hypothetical protein